MITSSRKFTLLAPTAHYLTSFNYLIFNVWNKYCFSVIVLASTVKTINCLEYWAKLGFLQSVTIVDNEFIKYPLYFSIDWFRNHCNCIFTHHISQLKVFEQHERRVQKCPSDSRCHDSQNEIGNGGRSFLFVSELVPYARLFPSRLVSKASLLWSVHEYVQPILFSIAFLDYILNAIHFYCSQWKGIIFRKRIG